MNILTTGAAGMLGTSLVPIYVAAGHNVIATDIDLMNPEPWGPGAPRLERLDVRERDAVRDAFDDARPDLVLHLAAETSLEVCDDDPDHAYLTNTVATKYIALECRRRDIPMVFISTAGVFDGTKTGAYTEFDQPNPINTYSASKYEAEKLVSSILDRYYIIRAGWMVGGGNGKDHKFVARILEQVRQGRTEIYAVGDKYGTPTYTYDFGTTGGTSFRSRKRNGCVWTKRPVKIVQIGRDDCKFFGRLTGSPKGPMKTKTYAN